MFLKKTKFLTEYLRALWFGIFFKSFGTSVFISRGFSCEEPKNVSLGHHIYINHDVTIGSDPAGVEIGNYVQIAPYVFIMNSIHAHDRTDIPMFEQKGYKVGKVVIQDDVWLGLRVIVLPGVTIHKGAIVGAGA